MVKLLAILNIVGRMAIYAIIPLFIHKKFGFKMAFITICFASCIWVPMRQPLPSWYSKTCKLSLATCNSGKILDDSYTMTLTTAASSGLNRSSQFLLSKPNTRKQLPRQQPPNRHLFEQGGTNTGPPCHLH